MDPKNGQQDEDTLFDSLSGDGIANDIEISGDDIEIIAGEGDPLSGEEKDTPPAEGAPADDPEDAPEDDSEPEDDADDAPEDDSEPEDDPEDDPALKNMKPAFIKRLKREQRSKREAQKIAQRAIEILGERENEVTTLKQQQEQLQAGYAELLENSLNERLTIKTRELRAARDDGEIDKEVELQSELDDIRYRLNKVKEVRSSLPAPTTAPAPAPVRPPLSPLAEKWVARNRKWLNHKDYAAERAATVAIDAQIKAEGFNPLEEDYYKELDRRIDKKFPTLRKAPAKEPPPQPVAAATLPGTSKPKDGKLRFVLNAQERAAMRSFNLNPDDPKAQKAWARERLASMQRGE